MTDKQQIEDMATIMKAVKYAPFNQGKPTYTVGNQMGDFVFDLVAEALYNANYRRIDENAVVLTQEEKQDLIHEMYEKGKFDTFIELRSTVYENTRKETARELLELIYQSLVPRLVCHKDGHFYFEEFYVTYTLNIAEKQFGVKIKKPWEVE